MLVLTGARFYPPGVWPSHTPGFFFIFFGEAFMPKRAILFIDGNNWYHSLKNRGVPAQGNLSYRLISQKLVQDRMWVETRYYVGRVPQVDNPRLYADQRRFVSQVESEDGRISVHFGRLEQRPVKDTSAIRLRRYLADLNIQIPRRIYRGLYEIANEDSGATTWVEKAVDVMLAIDVVVMAERDQYDTAYILSADGDFTPAVDAARACGKHVIAASPARGAKLAASVNTYIRLQSDWFSDCYLEDPI